MQLQNALSQISQIKQQMERTRTFRGYRAGTTLLTGLAAIAAAIWQSTTTPDPAAHWLNFVDLWVSVAVASAVIVGAEIVQRYRSSESSLERELTLLAVEQFLPCLVVGGLVTLILSSVSGAAIWLLPGLWAIFFGMGMFASRRVLPAKIIFVAAFYLLCGLGCLAMGPAGIKYSAWTMGITFGAGQIACAAILYWSLERRHEN